MPTTPFYKRCKKFSGHIHKCKPFSSRPGHNDDVFRRHGNQVPVQTKPFPQTPFDSVPADGVPEAFLYDQAEAVMRLVVRREADAEMGRAYPPARSFHSLIFGR